MANKKTYYKNLEERIRSENLQEYVDMLNSPYPAFKSNAIKELTKRKVKIPTIKNFLQDPNEDVRVTAYTYLEKMGILDEKTVKESLKDKSPKIRQKAIASYITMGIKPIEYILRFAKDPNPNVRYQLLTTFLEVYPENSNKLIEILKDDPYKKIRQLIYSLDNISDTLISPQVEKNIKYIALKRFYEASDSITFFNTLKDVYFKCDIDTKILIIKFFSNLPCKIINQFMEKIIHEESNLVILQATARTIRKACGIDLIPSWLVETFIKSDDVRIVKYGLNLAIEKEDNSYVDFCRKLLNDIDDDLVISAVNYLLHFQDYSLADYVNNFLNSPSSKRIKTGLKIIRKLKLENFVGDVASIASNKEYPVSIRKNALNLLKFFKANNYWEIPYQIIKDSNEHNRLKSVALNVLWTFNPQMLTLPMTKVRGFLGR